jgi:hypothetical protein
MEEAVMFDIQQHRSSRRVREALHTWRVLAVIAMMTLGAATASAQEAVVGSIFGTVTDSSGGVLPGVTVTLKSPAIQAPQLVTVTGTDGTFKFGQLFNGVYQISYQLSGFATVTRADQTLPAGMQMRLDATMTGRRHRAGRRSERRRAGRGHRVHQHDQHPHVEHDPEHAGRPRPLGTPVR